MHVLKPVIHETIWGGRRLCPTDGRAIGHLYSVVDGAVSNELYDGSYVNFHAYFEAVKDRCGLSGFSFYPYTAALVDAAEHLSIQVHPDDHAAKVLEHRPHGKNESWYFLEAPESGWIYNGCTAESTAKVRTLLDRGMIESVTAHLPVKKGDYVYVQAGTLHALTAGSLVFEIEENCPLTYRFYDYERRDSAGKKRELHIEQALSVLKPGLQSAAVKENGSLIEERMYSLRLIRGAELYQNDSDTLETLTLLSEAEADGVLYPGGAAMVLEPGERVGLNHADVMMVRPNTGFSLQQ